MCDYRKDFPIFEHMDAVYLDSAATSQKPESVIQAVADFDSKYNANPHRGTYGLSMEATSIYEKTREKVAKFIHAPKTEQIIFTKNASEALNLVAYSYGLWNLCKEDEVVLSIMEHHSDIVPWQFVTRQTGAKLQYMYLNHQYELDEAEIQDKITKHTKIVGITHISNVLGTINPVKKIIQRAHEQGALVIVDVSQSIAHMEINVQELDADFVVFSAHKMFGPMGIGVLYGKKELLENMHPFLMGGDMIEYVYEQTATFAPLPNKFEAGTQNAEAVAGFGAAIDYIQSIGYDAIHQKEQELLQYAWQQLEGLDYLECYLTPDMHKRSAVISFNIRGIHPHDTAGILDMEKVCVRAGNHCAQPLLRYLGLDATCRASFGIYNTKEDIDKLVQALNKTYEMFRKYIPKEENV